MICEECGKEFFKDWRKDKRAKKTPCRFCSRSCSNTQHHSNETKEKISDSIKKYCKTNTISNETKKKKKESLKKSWEERKKKVNENILNENFNDLKYDRIKKRILLEQNNKCNICGIQDWNGKSLTLELEHKDGNHQNNLRENVECLCPNCHSQTSTFRGRNKKARKTRVFCSDEVFVETFIEEGNIHKTLLKLGYAPKGANYGRVKRALTIAGIEYNKK